MKLDIKKMRWRISLWMILLIGLVIMNLNAIQKGECGLRNGMCISTLDLVCLLLKGEPIILGEQMQNMPIQWMSICCSLIFVSCNYSCGELTDNSYKTLIYSKSRKRWWMSKTIFVHSITFILFCVLVVISAVTVSIKGNEQFALYANLQELQMLNSLARAPLFTQVVWVLVLPCIAFCVISSMQNVISILFGSTVSFFASILVLVMSTSIESKILFPALTMTSRTVRMYELGARPKTLLCFMVVFDVVVNGIGYLAFRNKSLMDAKYLEVNQ